MTEWFNKKNSGTIDRDAEYLIIMRLTRPPTALRPLYRTIIYKKMVCSRAAAVHRSASLCMMRIVIERGAGSLSQLHQKIRNGRYRDHDDSLLKIHYHLKKPDNVWKNLCLPQKTPCHTPCKESSSIFLIGPFDASKYDIIWTENKNLTDRLLPQILTFKECSKHVHHVFDKCWTRFEHFERRYLWISPFND